MYDYRKQMIKEYHEKLAEYRNLLGTIPTDEKEMLENILSNPENEREMDFCINCLRFFKDSTKSFASIEEELKRSNASEEDIDRWLETVDGLLYHHRYTFDTKKEFYKKLIEQRNDLVRKITTWTNETLSRILLEPSTDEEYRLCQEYISYLNDEVDFKKRKDNYLERLLYRHEEIEELLKSPYKKDMAEILLEPYSEKELDFCTSYFGFIDDKKGITEAVKVGTIKTINPEESSVVEHISGIINVLINDDDMQDKLFFLRDPAETADVLYELCILEYDKNRLVNTIANKLGYSSQEGTETLEPQDYFKVYVQYEEAVSLINDLIFYRIDREDKHNKMNKFLSMSQYFHHKYVTDTYEDSSSVKINPQGETKGKQKIHQ